MIPSEFPNSRARGIDLKAGDTAELQVFEALKKLDDSYVCIYSYRLKTREVDFLIMHPQMPLIFVEVKGGLFVQKDNFYYMQNRKTGELIGISPIEQLYKAQEELLQELSKILPQQKISWSFKVMFPSCFRPSEPISGQLADKSIFGPELEHLQAHFQPLMQFPPLGKEVFETLKKYFQRSIKSESYDPVESDKEIEQKIELISKDILEDRIGSISENSKFVVRGPAGSGKTLMLKKLALHLSEQGKKVLVTCFNDLLEAHLKTQIGDSKNRVIFNFHNLCKDLIKKSPVNLEMGRTETKMIHEGTHNKFFEDWLPNQLLVAIENLKACNQLEQFDVLLVDEAQDFKDYWLMCVKELIVPTGIMGIFTDPLQDLTKEKEAKEALFENGSYTINLRTNLRNTKQICNFASEYYLATAKDLNITVEALRSPYSYPEGLPPTITTFKAEADLKSMLGKLLHQLVVEDQIPLSKITILTNRSAKKIEAKSEAIFKRGLQVGPYVLAAESQEAPKNVQLETARRFKGRENLVVISVEFGELEKSLAYVTYSRALARLYVLRG